MKFLQELGAWSYSTYEVFLSFQTKMNIGLTEVTKNYKCNLLHLNFQNNSNFLEFGKLVSVINVEFFVMMSLINLKTLTNL